MDVFRKVRLDLREDRVSDPKRYTNWSEFRRVVRFEWRTRRVWRNRRAALRGLWHSLVCRYACEICPCGHRVGDALGDTYWHASDELWNEVAGESGWEERAGDLAYLGVPGTLCPRCFTGRARAKGISVHWEPVR